ncbi:MAG: hypothetical protein MUC92_05735 [Fimbriimonadaceae bacterium]|jgi:hypothetical protein|nr:hypothetical protein [Fimbriimonadaceae bacterium]
MNCRDCHRYDPETETCKDRKLNPKSWEQAVDCANTYGVRSVCIFNDHREKLISGFTLPVSNKQNLRKRP